MPTGMSTAAMPVAPRFTLVKILLLGGWSHLTACAPETDTIVPTVTDSRPRAGETWPADRPLTVTFDHYLDPDTITDGLARLTSGELPVATWVEYDPVGPAVEVHPFIDLRPGLGYTLTLATEAIEALGGAAGAGPVELRFIAGPPLGTPPPGTPSDAAVAQVFDARCGCHGPAPAAFPALRRDALVGVPSARQPDRVLVIPGRPMASYLVQRILEDYPGVRGMEKALSDDERRLIVRWVEGL